MKNKSVKVIFDTNVWISFLIVKRLAIIKQYIINRQITIGFNVQLLTEIKIVTSHDKLSKYFPKENVKELIELLKAIAEKIEITPTHFICRDKKDNFLFDLIDFSKADYLGPTEKRLKNYKCVV
jgi:putative PIN family toxin of toxin-antitoxin system